MPATDPISQLNSSRVSTREKGMETIIAQGEFETALEYALKDEAARVVDIAAEALFPEPIELLLHVLTVTKGPDASLAARFHLPNGNYLYAEKEVCAIFRKRGSRIHPDVVEGLGRSYMRGIAPLLMKLLDEPIMNLAVAKAAEIPNGTSGVRQLVRTEDKHTWSGPTTRAIVSTIALRRLECEMEPDVIQRMLDAVEDSMAECPEKQRTRIALQWVLHDVKREGFEGLFKEESAIGLSTLADVAISHLKRSEHHLIPPLVENFGDVYFWEDGFSFWPLFDFLASEGLSDFSKVRTARGYLRARKRNIDPPPWWKWISPSSE